MKLYTFEQSFDKDLLLNKIVLSDSSFVIALTNADDRSHRSAVEFFDRHPETLFYIESTVRQELLHLIRRERLSAILGQNPKVTAARRKLRNIDIAKILINAGEHRLVKQTLDPFVFDELERCESGFTYEPDTEEEKEHWVNVGSKMRNHCLGVADTLILDFALRKEFDSPDRRVYAV